MDVFVSWFVFICSLFVFKKERFIIMKKVNVLLLLVILALPSVALTGCFGTVEVGERGVKVAQGVVDKNLLKEGFYTYNPFFERVEEFVIRQTTKQVEADVQTRDMQTIKMDISISYKIPDASVITIFKDYQGDAYETLVHPKLLDALKSVTSAYKAEDIIKKRDEIRLKTVDRLNLMLGGLVDVKSVMFTGTTFSETLQKAIEEKQKAEIEESTAKNRVEVEKQNSIALAIRAKALKSNPALMQEKFIEKWDGHLPQVMGQNTSITQVVPK